MKINLNCVLVLNLVLYVRTSGNPPAVPGTDVIQKLGVEIIYMTAEPTSRKWFQTSFEPAYKKLSKCLDIFYNPCVMSSVMPGSEVLGCGNAYDPMCKAAAIQACAVSIVQDTSAVSQFIICSMTVPSDYPTSADFKKCASDAKIQYEPIEGCARGDLGQTICQETGIQLPTGVPTPAFSFDPTFDEKLSKDITSSKDLVKSLCEQMKKHDVTCSDCPTC